MLRAKEGLALNNGTQVMNGIGALALLRAERAAATADVAGAMSLEALIAGLLDRGYVEGRNYRMEVRWTDNQVDRLPALARELVAKRARATPLSATRTPPKLRVVARE